MQDHQLGKFRFLYIVKKSTSDCGTKEQQNINCKLKFKKNMDDLTFAYNNFLTNSIFSNFE
jgi:hypothetical protein